MALEMKRKELNDQAETQSYQNAQKKNKTLGGELSAEEIEKLRKRVLKNKEDDALKNWEEIDKISKVKKKILEIIDSNLLNLECDCEPSEEK